MSAADPPELLTGIVVEVPEAESLVDAYRQRLDPRAPEGIPAHLTVADRAALDRMRAAEAAIRPRLPIDCSAVALTLFEEEEPGQFRLTGRYALGRPAPVVR